MTRPRRRRFAGGHAIRWYRLRSEYSVVTFLRVPCDLDPRMRPAWLQLTNEIVERYGYTVPELLTRIRVVYHLSQTQLAAAAGCSHATVSHWETGKHSPRA